MATDLTTVPCPQQENTELLAADSTRMGFEVKNLGPGMVRLNFSGSDAESGIGVPLKEGKRYILLGGKGAENDVQLVWPNTAAINCFPEGDGSDAGGRDPTADCIVKVVHLVKDP